MKTALLLIAVFIAVLACREEFHQLTPPEYSTPASTTNCQAQSIEKNIVGTWQFETIPPTGETIRKGTVTFDAQKNMIDPDSLYANYIDTGSAMARVVTKTYDPDGAYPPIGYTGQIFRVDLVTKDGRYEKWPMYVFSNGCKKIVIYQVGTYNNPVKVGFTLTRL